MSWFDLEVPQIFIAESSKQSINRDIFKQALENRPNQFCSICGSKNVVITI